MKRILYFISIMVGMTACSDDPMDEVAENTLIGTWTLGNSGYVQRDAQDITSEYSDLSIVFQESKLTVSNGGQIFPIAEDSWSYTSQDKTTIVRASDNIEMKVELVDDFLFLRFFYSYTIIITGRLSLVEGNHVIKLVRNK